MATSITELNHPAIAEAFLRGVRHQIEDKLNEYCAQMIAEMNTKINAELKAMAKEAAQCVATEVLTSFQGMDPERRWQISVEILEKPARKP